MSIEFTHVPTPERNESGHQASFLDSPDAMRRLAQLEQAAFGSIVVDLPGGIFANMDAAADAACRTESINLAVTHWPGVIEPAFAAQQIAELDRLSSGRVALRCVPQSAATGVEAPASHEASWQQLDEYLVLLKRLWANDRPIDHEGPHYSMRDGYVSQKGPSGADIPIRLGGVSGTAIKIAGRHADIFELAPLPRYDLRGLVDRVLDAAARHGRDRKIRFALPISVGGEASAPDARHAVTLPGSLPGIVQTLREYVSLGIGEFMVTGVSNPADLESFARNVAPLAGIEKAPRRPGHGRQTGTVRYIRQV